MSQKENQELQELVSKYKPGNKLKTSHSPVYYEDDEGEKDDEMLNLCQWTTGDNRRFVPSGATKKLLPPGVYEIHQSTSIGLYFERFPVRTEGLIRFPQTNSEKVLNQIDTFWNKEKIFTEYNLPHKRGILLWGGPGCLADETYISYNDSGSSIEQLYEDFNNSNDFYALSINEEEKIVKNRIVDVVKSGKKECFLLKTSTSEIKATADHKFFSNGEYIKLSDLKIGNIVGVERGNDKIVSITSVGVYETYDIQMMSPYNNFVANNFIVHNSGKTCTVNLIMKDVVEDRKGIVIKFTHPALFLEGMRVLREIEKNTPVVVLMEDIDAILDNHDESQVLNILDGVESVQRCVFLATTNYPERLGPRVVNRPSRFDKRYKIGYPDKESRTIYFKYLCGKKSPEDLGINLTKWVADTENFSIAHLKELFVAVVILGDTYKESLGDLKSMGENISSEHDESKTMNLFVKDEIYENNNSRGCS